MERCEYKMIERKWLLLAVVYFLGGIGRTGIDR